MSNPHITIWRNVNGEIISCVEKIKVMHENLEEIQQLLQDAYEDALLMDINPQQIKQIFVELINNLHNPYREPHV